MRSAARNNGHYVCLECGRLDNVEVYVIRDAGSNR